MLDSRVNAEAQGRLAALLRYFQRGDFASFSRIVGLAFDPLIGAEAWDVLLAAQIGGLCEVSGSTGVIRWWVAHEKDIRIRSRAPKWIGTRTESLEHQQQRLAALIVDAQSRPLSVGLHEVAAALD
jgi:hypothetical protein